MTDVKPCPFCGGNVALYAEAVPAPETPTFFSIHCHQCRIYLTRPGKLATIEAWNSRSQAGSAVSGPDAQRLSDYAEELENTVAGGGTFFAPRDCAGFAKSLRVLLSGPAPREREGPTDSERLDWLAHHTPCPDGKPLTSLGRAQIDGMMRDERPESARFAGWAAQEREADSARLDWLEANPNNVVRMYDDSGWAAWNVDEDTWGLSGPTLREAIDAARKA